MEQTSAVPMRLAFCCVNYLEEITGEKGGIRQLLDEKWRKVYQANAPRGLFTSREALAA